MRKFVYSFSEGSADMRELLGGKGANLCEMTNIGLNVPPGFVITTEACLFYVREKRFPPGLEEAMRDGIRALEEATGKGFGDPENPLLVSVRSGAAVSMPGMMDTVLNLGLNGATTRGLAAATSPAFAYNCYRRLLHMFGHVVLDIDNAVFEAELEAVMEKEGVDRDTDLSAEGWSEVASRYANAISARGKTVPEDPWEQLTMAIEAVFQSWENPRAVAYREANGIPHDLCTAVNVQAMVFGNLSEDSGTGVLFTRDPATGEDVLYGEYLMNAQGEDVVGGIRTPKPVALLEAEMPEVYRGLLEVRGILEDRYREMEDVEFTIERGQLFILQTRRGQRTAAANVKIAVDMVSQGLIDREEALRRVSPEDIERLLHKQIDPNARLKVLATGLNASPGAAVGEVVFDPDVAASRGDAGEAVVLVRKETVPDDVHGIIASQGVLTSRGGMTSHAAIVTRGMGKPCVAGCEALSVDYDEGRFTVGDTVVREGEVITIDGTTGRVILGEVPLVEPQIGGEAQEILSWADEVRRLGVRANADTPEDARRARELGAEGIGLCRTEHMFMAEERLPSMQEMILAEDEASRRKALDKLLPMQVEDFVGILREMEGFAVTIRLLDPPLHEFLPNLESLLVDVTTMKLQGASEADLRAKEALMARVRSLHEANPMLGLRGCRLGLIFPEINEMQTRAILTAAIRLKKEGVDVKTEIMIPLVGHVNEIARVQEQLESVAQATMEEEGMDVDYAFGTMVEIPRAALTAAEIARYAEFFSFGTNDLTQTTFGYSRDDAEGKFLFKYLEMGILPRNPFEVLDRDGVGRLMRFAVKEGRETRPDLKVGICGEHGGEPSSIAFCHEIGLDYVSCSPYRVPVARLAAAHAALAVPGGISGQ
jgi:pyruvate,orthophosphate dikinase